MKIKIDTISVESANYLIALVNEEEYWANKYQLEKVLHRNFQFNELIFVWEKGENKIEWTNPPSDPKFSEKIFSTKLNSMKETDISNITWSFDIEDNKIVRLN